jgi:thiaminase
MVSQFVDNVYDKLKNNVKESKLNPYESWVSFIETNEVLNNLEESVAEMELEGD